MVWKKEIFVKIWDGAYHLIGRHCPSKKFWFRYHKSWKFSEKCLQWFQKSFKFPPPSFFKKFFQNFWDSKISIYKICVLSLFSKNLEKIFKTFYNSSRIFFHDRLNFPKISNIFSKFYEIILSFLVLSSNFSYFSDVCWWPHSHLPHFSPPSLILISLQDLPSSPHFYTFLSRGGWATRANRAKPGAPPLFCATVLSWIMKKYSTFCW